MKPEPSAYGEFYRNYIELVPNSDLIDGLKSSAAASLQFWNSIPEEKGNYRYAEGKWSIKELLQHIIDTERIFSYRALAIARGDQTALPGYDENTYAENCRPDARSLKEMVDELELVRKSTIALFKSFDESVLDHLGKASGSNLSVRAAGFII
ncbi:MAG: DinB family protein, partial [Flavobacteriales bacterium]|nr:DinB family protein [Flavobacteriales bacterium]